MLHMGSHYGGGHRQSHLPRPAGHAAANSAKGMVGFLGCESASLAHVHLFNNQYPHILLCRAALNSIITEPVLILGVAPCHRINKLRLNKMYHSNSIKTSPALTTDSRCHMDSSLNCRFLNFRAKWSKMHYHSPKNGGLSTTRSYLGWCCLIGSGNFLAPVLATMWVEQELSMQEVLPGFHQWREASLGFFQVFVRAFIRAGVPATLWSRCRILYLTFLSIMTFKLIQLPLNVILSLRCMNYTISSGLICKYAEGALDHTACVANKDIKQYWSPYGPRRHTAHHWFPSGHYAV